jgi:hypothetical protein
VVNIDHPGLMDWGKTVSIAVEQAVINDGEIGNAPARYRGSRMSSIQPNPLSGRA